VFIRAKALSWELAAGDIELRNAPGSFMVFNRKGQGVLYRGEFSSGKEEQWKHTTTFSASVARGKFNTNRFNGLEGNQGPYKLTGAGNEQFIMVLAGSEQVFLDGRLLTRGANNDYVIDYNTAEITFTPKAPITREMRFMVTFEYAERNYNRSMLYASQEAASDKTRISLQYFMDQDLKSQPLGQEQLIEEHAGLLKQIGDDLAQAVVPNVKEVPYNNSEVLYKKVDTLVGTTLYPGVYIYSTHPDSAIYRLGFAWVGPGNGHYQQTTSAANGKVFRWVAPIGGAFQGDYEPVILLVTPKRQQMLTLGGSTILSRTLTLFAEGALSGLDLNTFSNHQDQDNLGSAFTIGYSRKSLSNPDSSEWRFSSEGLYRFVQHRFTALERFREVEYERDWSITAGQPRNEHYGKLILALQRKRTFASSYTFEPLMHAPDDYALRQSVVVDAAPGNWQLRGRGSYTSNVNNYLPVSFVRHQISVERKGKWLTVGVVQEGEENRQQLPGVDELFGGSFAFQRWQGTVTRTDSAGLITRVRVGQRYDFTPTGRQFEASARADEVMAGMSRMGGGDHRFDFNVGYRRLAFADTLNNAQQEQSLTGRGEYHHKFWKGLLRGTVQYEFGSGLEYRKEFTYLEVAPGQGMYTWNDYNNDSVKQLNEFELAVFQDEASYIRVFTPTNTFERVYTMQYNQSFHLDPAARVDRAKPWGRFLARFADQGNYRVEQKIGGDNPLAALDPFRIAFDDPTTIQLNYSLRNTLFFNRSNPKYGIEYTTARNAARMLLVNGFEQRTQMQHQWRTRWNITRAIILRGEGNLGHRLRASEFFASNDYNIEQVGGGAELQFQPGTTFRISGRYSYSDKTNRGPGGEKATLHRATAEFRHTQPSKGNLQVLAEYIGIAYNSTAQSSIAFEMLEGLNTGNNFTWTVAYQRTLTNNMQLNIQYNGRKSPSNPMVHVGTVQVRAFF
jgi:hypothetical protein